MEPKNLFAKIKRENMTQEALQLIDALSVPFGELQAAYDDKLASLSSGISADLAEAKAKLELVTNPDVQKAIRFIVDTEEKLEALTKVPDGKGSFIDRVLDLERVTQLLEKGGGTDPEKFLNDPRVEAFELYKPELQTNPMLADVLKFDPRLNHTYARATAQYIRKGHTTLTAPQVTVLGKGWNFQEALDNYKVQQLAQLLTEEAMNALSSEFAPGGGIWIQPTMEARILRKVTEGSPLFDLAGKKTSTSNRHEFTIETGHLPETFDTGERATRQEETEDAFWEVRHIDIHEENTTIFFTSAQLEDSTRDILAEAEDLIARSFLKRMSGKLINGTGVTPQCQGLLKDTRIPVINTGTATTLPSFRLQQMHVDMLPEYLPNASYLLGIGALMSLILERDAVNRPLWQPSLQDGTPSLYAGYRWRRDPYLDRENAVTDSAVTFATGAKPVVFGDFAQLYWIVQRAGIRVIRDEVTKKGKVGMTYYRRWGAGVAQPDAGRILKVAA